ncbi:hypothetical protein NDU88_001724 [Pleurodeles waltl]|uniref:Nuclear apoptosis-inducing factor 1 n=1 Tax=Pleurodeles waltl TaxID=8319 RepID=A0AAV7LC62_PLEWA|nr:hypothetical protein NDU88_001724 [Pleurodeles waltl]
MDPRCLYRPQEDDNRPGTSQEDPHKTQDSMKKKRKCRFSADEQEILVKEVTEHQHQLFVTSKLLISRREAIWQQIVDKINTVAEVRRTVIECKKRWHDCMRRTKGTKEKMARNRKAAPQTGGGSPAHNGGPGPHGGYGRSHHPRGDRHRDSRTGQRRLPGHNTHAG